MLNYLKHFSDLAQIITFAILFMSNTRKNNLMNQKWQYIGKLFTFLAVLAVCVHLFMPHDHVEFLSSEQKLSCCHNTHSQDEDIDIYNCLTLSNLVLGKAMKLNFKLSIPSVLDIFLSKHYYATRFFTIIETANFRYLDIFNNHFYDFVELLRGPPKVCNTTQFAR